MTINRLLVCAAWISFAVLSFLYGHLKLQEHRYLLKKKQLEEQLDYMKEHADMMQTKIQEVVRYDQEIQQYMDQLDGTRNADGIRHLKQVSEQETLCEDPLLNYIFQRKKNECENRGIEFLVDMAKIHVLQINPLEKVSIFYNLLDNAMEACMRMAEHEKRYIHIRGYMRKHNYHISVENTKSSEMILNAGKRTWKEDSQQHGIGTEVLSSLVKSHNGEIHFREEEHRFVSELEFYISDLTLE